MGDPCGISSKEHWESLYRERKLPIELHRRSYNVRRFDELLREKLPPGGGTKLLLEFGAGGSAWLPYFHKEFGYRVEGLDYVEEGCRLAEENLRFLGIEGRCRRADVLRLGDELKGSADAVFSYGFLEHFSDFGRVFAVMESCLRPGGILVVIVPNAGNFLKYYGRLMNPELHNQHMEITPGDMAVCARAAGLETVCNGYFGTFFLGTVGWQRTIKRPLLLKAIGYTSAAISAALLAFRVKVETRFFSPYVVYVGRKAGSCPAA